jgi:hypothetical protein
MLKKSIPEEYIDDGIDLGSSWTSYLEFRHLTIFPFTFRFSLLTFFQTNIDAINAMNTTDEIDKHQKARPDPESSIESSIHRYVKNCPA